MLAKEMSIHFDQKSLLLVDLKYIYESKQFIYFVYKLQAMIINQKGDLYILGILEAVYMFVYKRRRMNGSRTMLEAMCPASIIILVKCSVQDFCLNLISPFFFKKWKFIVGGEYDYNVKSVKTCQDNAPCWVYYLQALSSVFHCVPHEIMVHYGFMFFLLK